MQHNEKMFLYVEADPKAETGMKFSLIPGRFRYYMSDDAVQVAELDITYTIPVDLTEETLRGLAIATLEDKQQRVLAEAYQKKEALQRKIDNLKLLTYNPTTVVSDEDDIIPF